MLEIVLRSSVYDIVDFPPISVDIIHRKVN